MLPQETQPWLRLVLQRYGSFLNKTCTFVLYLLYYIVQKTEWSCHNYYYYCYCNIVIIYIYIIIIMYIAMSTIILLLYHFNKKKSVYKYILLINE